MKCPECKAKEAEIARKKRVAQEKAAAERRAIAEKEQIAKEKSERRAGCGCLVIVIVFVCLVIWGPEWFPDAWYGDWLWWIREVCWIVIKFIGMVLGIVFSPVLVVLGWLWGLIAG